MSINKLSEAEKILKLKESLDEFIEQAQNLMEVYKLSIDLGMKNNVSQLDDKLIDVKKKHQNFLDILSEENNT